MSVRVRFNQQLDGNLGRLIFGWLDTFSHWMARCVCRSWRELGKHPKKLSQRKYLAPVLMLLFPAEAIQRHTTLLPLDTKWTPDEGYTALCQLTNAVSPEGIQLFCRQLCCLHNAVIASVYCARPRLWDPLLKQLMVTETDLCWKVFWYSVQKGRLPLLEWTMKTFALNHTKDWTTAFSVTISTESTYDCYLALESLHKIMPTAFWERYIVALGPQSELLYEIVKLVGFVSEEACRVLKEAGIHDLLMSRDGCKCRKRQRNYY